MRQSVNIQEPHSSFKRASTSFSSDQSESSEDNEQNDEHLLTKKPCIQSTENEASGFPNFFVSNLEKFGTGLGSVSKDLNTAAELWNSGMKEVVELKEKYQWLINDKDDLNDFTPDVLKSWIVVDKRKSTIDDETKFVDSSILNRILTSKSAFDYECKPNMMQARNRSNPFETIKRSIFLNRDGVKMANLDAMFDGMFTNPVDENDDPLVSEKDILYFADVCGGPGGYSEYMLYRKKWMAKGFGFSDRICYKLDEFKAGSPASFDLYYGKQGDDIIVPENIESFKKYVLQQTETGVFFMIAVGWASVNSQHNIQEILSKQIYLCQIIVALAIVREMGHFVVRVFDLFTPFSVGLVYFMYKCFQQITIVKPNTSRPANSERFIVCKWKKPNTDAIYRHLFNINEQMYKSPKSPLDTLELVPYDVMQNDARFFDFICNSNNQIGQNQIAGLIKIAAFCKNPNLLERRQNEIEGQCLNLWNLPNTKEVEKFLMPGEHCDELLKQWSTKNFFDVEEKIIEGKRHLHKEFNDLYDWKFVAIGNTKNIDKTVRTLFMGQGDRVYMYLPEKGGYWDRVQLCIKLSPNTLVYGEIVNELIGEHRYQKMVHSFHIIDAIVLGGIDVRSLPLQKRNEMCQKFAKSVNKPHGVYNQSIPIRCKILYRLPDMKAFFDRLTRLKMKNGNTQNALRLRNDFEGDRFFEPRGLLFFKETKMALSTQISKSNAVTLPDSNQIYASFLGTFVNRRLWPWELGSQVDQTYVNTNVESTMLYRTDLMSFIDEKEQA